MNKKIIYYAIFFSIVMIFIIMTNYNIRTSIPLQQNIGNKDSIKTKSLRIKQDTVKENVNPLEGVWYIYKRASGITPLDTVFNSLTHLIIKNNRITKIINKKIIFEDTLVFRIDTIAKTKNEVYIEELYFLPKKRYEIYYNVNISLYYGHRMAEGVMVELYKKKSDF